MNNLLRTLTERRIKTNTDLRLLLNVVKDGRRQSYDTKLSDPFYDSLENLLLDLKTITIDNRDAEAFLKPVSKAEVPDYYDVIANPMDFQTMLKKVKQKQYKSKREFKDDLELIWSNCYTYNATENHPLRQCVKRLRAKSDRLLKYITDRKERADPPIPSDLAIIPQKLNGVNGHSHTILALRKSTTPTATAIKPSTPLPSKRLSHRNLPFSDTPAIIRTPEGMAAFLKLDRDISNARLPNQRLVEQMRELAPLVEIEDGTEPPTPDAMEGILGDKRKLNGNEDPRPRKRVRLCTQFANPIPTDDDDLTGLWWSAVQSEDLLANGLPNIPFSSSEPRPLKPKRRKVGSSQQPKPKALLTLMNNNVKSMKRMRMTHAKFSALTAANSGPAEDGEGEASFGGSGPGLAPIGTSYGIVGGDDEDTDSRVDERPWTWPSNGTKKAGDTVRAGVEIGETNAVDCLKWTDNKILEHAGFQGTSKIALDVLVSVTSDYLLNVGRTIRYLSDIYSKTMSPEEIILHTLFESGTSKVQDLERYIKDDIERYGVRLVELEKKLVGAYRESTAGEMLEDEGLFDEEDEEETGALATGDFADLLGEDYLGLRELGIAAEFGMSSLSIPKRLLKGKKNQNKPAAVKPSEPPPPYPPPPPFVQLTLAKVDDQIGILKDYYKGRFDVLAGIAAPAPALPIPVPVPAPLPGPLLNINTLPMPYSVNPYPPISTPQTASQAGAPGPSGPFASSPPVILVLPEDSPDSTHAKIGPLGQVVKPGAGASTAKKKAKATDEIPSTTLVNGPQVNVTPISAAPTPAIISSLPTPIDQPPEPVTKKKKGGTGVGTGNGRKKKLADMQALGQGPSGGQGQGNGHGQGQGSPFPPILVASA